MKRARDSASVRRLIVGLAVIVVVLGGIYVFFWSGVFGFQPEHGETFWHLLHQKGCQLCERYESDGETGDSDGGHNGQDTLPSPPRFWDRQ